MNTKEFEANFQFVGSRIKNFVIDNSYYRMNDTNTESKSIDFKKRILEINPDDDEIYGLIEILVEAYIKSEAEETAPQNEYQYHVRLQMEGVFSASNQLNEEEFKKMLEINGSAALYSIARAFIMNTTSQTLLEGQVVLPLLNFFDIPTSEK